MGPVQAVIPNTPEAEQIILMLSKNVPSYIGNVLKDQGLPELFFVRSNQKVLLPNPSLGDGKLHLGLGHRYSYSQLGSSRGEEMCCHGNAIVV
jgi:hypothetical protein